MSSSRFITRSHAIRAINQHGILLTYPIDNRSEPESLWSVGYPGIKMRWEWDDEGDDRVARLWHLKTELSSSREVVYSKWFRGRATFFSREVFTHLMAAMETTASAKKIRIREAAQILEALEMNSPQSTKELKAATELQGKRLESTYQKAMKELWNRFMIVGFGEVEDGAFPSLAAGATSVLFEDLWEESKKIKAADAWNHLEQKLGSKNLFLKFLQKTGASGFPEQALR